MPMTKDPVRKAQLIVETRLRMIGNKYGLGVRKTEEEKRKRSERFSGEKNPMFGRTHNAETREKIRVAPKVKGEKHHAWKGGTAKWWRQQILKGQNNTCQRCGLQDFSEGFMEVDHIKSKKIYPESQFDLNNGQVLCPNCHRRKTMEDRKNHQYFSVKVDSRGHKLSK